MRFSVRKASRLASPVINKPTIEEAVETALMLMRPPTGSVKIEDHQTGKTYVDDEIRELRNLLNA